MNHISGEEMRSLDKNLQNFLASFNPNVKHQYVLMWRFLRTLTKTYRLPSCRSLNRSRSCNCVHFGGAKLQLVFCQEVVKKCSGFPCAKITARLFAPLESSRHAVHTMTGGFSKVGLCSANFAFRDLSTSATCVPHRSGRNQVRPITLQFPRL